MTTTSLPAVRTRVQYAVEAPTPDQVHRSVRHLLVNVGASIATVSAAAGAGGLAAHVYAELAKWLLVLAGVLATFTLLVLADAVREGRHWRYTEDV